MNKFYEINLSIGCMVWSWISLSGHPWIINEIYFCRKSGHLYFWHTNRTRLLISSPRSGCKRYFSTTSSNFDRSLNILSPWISVFLLIIKSINDLLFVKMSTIFLGTAFMILWSWFKTKTIASFLLLFETNLFFNSFKHFSPFNNSLHSDNTWRWKQ